MGEIMSGQYFKLFYPCMDKKNNPFQGEAKKLAGTIRIGNVFQIIKPLRFENNKSNLAFLFF